MKIKGPKENIRVKVNIKPYLPESWYYRNYNSQTIAQQKFEKDMMATAQRVIDDVKRHIDDIEDLEIDYDQKFICEYCGCVWGEKSNTYNGGCCYKDEENNPENKE